MGIRSWFFRNRGKWDDPDFPNSQDTLTCFVLPHALVISAISCTSSCSRKTMKISDGGIVFAFRNTALPTYLQHILASSQSSASAALITSPGNSALDSNHTPVQKVHQYIHLAAVVKKWFSFFSHLEKEKCPQPIAATSSQRGDINANLNASLEEK